MDYTAIFTAMKPILAQGTRDGLRLIGMGLATHGFIESGAGTEAFIGAGMTLAGLFWGWFTTKGYLQVGALLQKVTATKTSGDAVKAATVLPPAAAVDTPSKSISVQSVVKVILIAFMLSALFLDSQAFAQNDPVGKIVRDIKAANSVVKSQVAAAAAPDPVTPLPCTFQMLIKLTPANLLLTIKQCIAGKLVSDTQRALDSAAAFGTTGKGDADAVNCLTPALAIFQAGVETPAVPEAPAVLNTDGSVKTPAVAAIPAQDPGPILLYQKYREFTLSGALTACQSWFNGPINATAAAGIAGVGTVVGAAAVLIPK